MRANHTFLCSLLLASMPALAWTQALTPAIADQINAAARARVRLVDGRRGMLYRPRVDSSSLNYDHSESVNKGESTEEIPRPLLLGQIAQIEVTSGSQVGRGAMIGGGVGAGLALLAIVACRGSVCQPASAKQGVLAVAGWIVIGAGFGSMIGAGSPRWRSVYPAR